MNFAMKSFMNLIQKEHFILSTYMAKTSNQTFLASFSLCFKSSNICDNLELLNDNGISSYIGYVALHSSPVGKKWDINLATSQITEEYSKRLLRLPFHNNLSKEDVYEVTKAYKTTLLRKCTKRKIK